MAQTQFDAIIVDARLLRRSCRSCSATVPPGRRCWLYATTPLMITSRDTAPSGHGPAAVDERAGPAAQPHAEPVVAEGLAASIAERRQLPAGSAEQPPAADVHSGFRRCSPTATSRRRCRSSTTRAAICPPMCATSARCIPRRRPSFRPPPWWAELDGDRPVVHVTQGTIDNADLGRLVEPDDRGARRRGRHRGGHHRRPRRVPAEASRCR